MKAYIVLSLGLLVFLQACAGLAESSSNNADSNKESSEAALSREKRGSYNMLRLGRGLRMLRLGKRSGAPEVPEVPQDEIQALLEEYYSQFPGNIEDEMAGEDDIHPRFRRSTPPAAQDVSASSDDEGLNERDVQDEDMPVFDDEFGLYPEDFYGDLEGLYEPSEESDEQDRLSFSMPKLGKNAADDENSDVEMEKRPMSMLRLGKRPMSMLRLGKRPMSMLRLGKRPMSMLRLGKRPMSMLRLGKRPMSMLRLGKRPMSMLRLGKRPMSMLRLGKRPMSMLRLGKRPMSMLRLGKRPMSMLRLGKRPMSMLRLGKRPSLVKRDIEMTEDKRQLPMLRLGKKSSA